MSGAARRLVVHLDAGHPAEPSVTVLPGTDQVAVRLAEDTVLDTAALTSLLRRVGAALHPAGTVIPGPVETEVRQPIATSASEMVVFAVRASGSSVHVQLGREAATLPPREAILLLSRMAAVAIRAGAATLSPLPPATEAAESVAGAR